MLDRISREDSAIAFAERDRRRARKAQGGDGYYDAEGVRQGGLIAFVRYFWDILEPATPFVDGWPLWAMCEHLEAVTEGKITRLLINVPPGFMKSLLVDVFWPAWEWGAKGKEHYRYVSFSYSADLTHRDNGKFRDLVDSQRYKDLYGHTVTIRNKTTEKVINTRAGYKLSSSVGGVGTGERGDRIIIDDPHKVDQAESDLIRSTAVKWFREEISDRFNSLKHGAMVIIMQRVHEEDVSGLILENPEFGFEHLMIPMRFEYGRNIDAGGNFVPTSIGWLDPREGDGDLAWGARFDSEGCQKLEFLKGPYAWCTPGESPVLMADLSLKSISEVRKGDEVIGFNVGNDAKRARLKPTKVLAISKSVQPVVLLKLSGGRMARCTADHKWFTGRNDGTHKPYAPAHVGSRLKRVCPSDLPQVQTDEDIRLAGWVAGFFDGEGSVSLNKRRGDEGNSFITFFQSAEKNLPLCEKLETALNRLGFDWTCYEIQPTTLSSAGVPWQKRRSYFLKTGAARGTTKSGPAKRGNRLELNQRFLHLIQPTKWRDRLIDTTVNGRMFTTEERVLSIEPDGVETVYGLTTETGNYVVWGLASSNSGQYQQSPAPRGGGIFQREWWQVWEPKTWPNFDYVVASVDGAFTEKEENCPSAMTVWGIFDLPKDGEGPTLYTDPQTGAVISQVGNGIGLRRRLMLIQAWRKHLKFSCPPVERLRVTTVINNERFFPDYIDPSMGTMEKKIREERYLYRAQKEWGLLEWIRYTMTRTKAHLVLIEGKGPGLSAAQQLQQRYGTEGWIVQVEQVKGDKVARALAAQATFSQLGVYAPNTAWAQLVIDEMAVFPKGKTDDLTDSATQAINYLRRMGLAPSDEEVEFEEAKDRTYKKKLGPIYPV